MSQRGRFHQASWQALPSACPPGRSSWAAQKRTNNIYTLYTSSTGAAEQDLHKCVLSDRESLMLRTTSTKLFLQSPQFCAIRHVSRCQTRNAGCVVHAWALTKPAPCTLHKTGQVPYAIRMAMACVSYGCLCPAAQQGRSYPSGPEATLGCTPDQS